MMFSVVFGLLLFIFASEESKIIQLSIENLFTLLSSFQRFAYYELVKIYV